MKYIAVILFFSIFVFSCKKDQLLTDPGAKLSFSTDTVLFDTVFTQVGSTTKLFRIYNTHSQSMNITNIRLGAGTASQFRLNVDGVNGTSISDMEILGGDSLYAFVQVTVDPTNQNSPLLVSDVIYFETNGNTQKVYLTAIGQDVYLHKPDHFPTNGLPPYSIISCRDARGAVWSNDKPHLIFGYAVVDSNCTLVMLPGTKVYLHKNAVLWVYAYGSLQVLGQHNSEVTFEGDRLEADYKEIPGQWGYIWLMRGSTNNKIDWAKIKNGAIGLKVGDNSSYAQPSVVITNTIIKNQKAAAIYAINAHIYSYNCVFANCGQYVAALTYGGAYNFRQCTFANYWDGNPNNASGGAAGTPRATAALAFNNTYQDAASVVHVANLDTCDFRNCIITGDIAEELSFDNNTTLGTPFNYFFENCIVKTSAVNTANGPHYSFVFRNVNAAFKDVNKNDYNLTSSSAAIDQGTSSFYIPLDLNTNFRNGISDIGAYEYVP